MAKKNEEQSGKSQRHAKQEPSQGGSAHSGWRETVESIVIAFVLAFLFRTFEAEAFVIPTGSMAPTLMGAHKDLVCSNCGYPYRVSASEESPNEMDRAAYDRDPDAWFHNNQVIASVCPNCRYQMDYDPSAAGGPAPPKSYKGDRILVAKFPYDLSDPERWDVAVFKYPERARDNFIKRIVGLPGETVVIRGGNIYTRPDPPLADAPATIARKPPSKVQAMLQVVYDNDYLLPDLPRRWAPVGTSSWEALDSGRAYRIQDDSEADHWLAYRHLVPTPMGWQRLEQGEISSDEFRRAIQPDFITDFYAYNGGTTREKNRTRWYEDDRFGVHWVGDLALDLRLEVESERGEVMLALVEANRLFECRIDVANGKAVLSISGEPSFERTMLTPLRGPGKYQVQWANVDDQLLLWVNGKLIEFDGTYGPLKNRDLPTREDVAPARVGSRGAAVRVNHLRVLRDVYYVAQRGGLSMDDGGTRAVEFSLAEDQFLVLGDNSPRSKDSRLWDARDESGRVEYYVHRDLLIGKALYVYWPHALNHIPGTNIWFPLFPNFQRMKLVR